ncbi:unnamed protein product, partial [Prorocentrum cordatum]
MNFCCLAIATCDPFASRARARERKADFVIADLSQAPGQEEEEEDALATEASLITRPPWADTASGSEGEAIPVAPTLFSVQGDPAGTPRGAAPRKATRRRRVRHKLAENKGYGKGKGENSTAMCEHSVPATGPLESAACQRQTASAASWSRSTRPNPRDGRDTAISLAESAASTQKRANEGEQVSLPAFGDN